MLDDVASMHFAAFGIGGPDDVVPRPPEHVRCKNFGCNKPSTRKVDSDLVLHLPYFRLFPSSLRHTNTVWMLYWQSRRTSNPSAPTFVSCFSTMHSQGTLIQDTQSKRSLRLRLRQVPGPPRRHGPVCCELQWLCCVPGVFTTDYHLYFTRRQSIGRVVLTKRPGIGPVSKSVLTCCSCKVHVLVLHWSSLTRFWASLNLMLIGVRLGGVHEDSRVPTRQIFRVLHWQISSH